MSLYPASAADPYTLQRRAGTVDPDIGEPINLDGYTQVYSGLSPGQSTGVILTYDQSNGANFVDAVYTMTQPRCHMLNPFDGGVYDIKEPMLGCNGGLPTGAGYPYGNVWAQTVDKLRGAGFTAWRERVVICTVGAGGTTSTQWAAGGDCNARILVGARRLLAHGLVPDVVFRHQGESDMTSGFSALTVKNNIRSEVETLRAVGVTCPVIVANVAYSTAASVGTPAYLAVRQGQVDACDTLLGIFLGPDTDTVGSGGRYDDVHWNATGRNTVSTMFRNAIVAQVP